MKYIVDRIENHLAICEDESQNMIDIELSLLPKNIKEGSIIYYSNGKYKIDKKEEKKRIEIIKKKMESIWND